MNHRERIILQIGTSFPQAQVESVSKFTGGLVGEAYRVEISNPNKVLVAKFFPAKTEHNVTKSMKISNYLEEKGLPASHFYSVTPGDIEGIAIMDCASGQSANDAWESSSTDEKRTILENIGALLKRIHTLQIPSFWVHQKHEIASREEWIEWIKLRIQKYLAAAKQNLDDELVDFLKTKFSRLQDLYCSHPDFYFVPLHWDYHLSNINVNESGEISGVFDFDNAMKGHDMADVGQTIYWLIMNQKISDTKTFEHLFFGYGELSQADQEFAYLHFLLFLAGVMRSTWPKEDLKWLNDSHVEVLRRCIKGEYLFY